MEKIKLEEGHRYLLRNRGYRSLVSVTILEIAKNGIKIEYDNGGKSWVTPFNLSGEEYSDYEVLEELKTL